ncbi:hypothetical protein [Paenibacillus radicis (ex Gao et al. 2016)]|uniref:Uncharacterized protein n=1 Tax=Paenibacillus radicis (ex Gao et al. 2016) TaxID=1737354 RepID=A0A917GY40_9BACL|nr:hypothetical protein [Paenibacillus radicis (ex Gao et al. 2016)]GGG60779.1 hypothetical protein GCM10010918_12650 [Paenibacillus radicis (ex Gao et al. 2016)]
MNQYDTMTWFQDTADDKKWSSDWASDVDPFLLYLNKGSEQVKVIFYKQRDDDFTGVLLRYRSAAWK